MYRKTGKNSRSVKTPQRNKKWLKKSRSKKRRQIDVYSEHIYVFDKRTSEWDKN